MMRIFSLICGGCYIFSAYKFILNDLFDIGRPYDIKDVMCTLFVAVAWLGLTKRDDND